MRILVTGATGFIGRHLVERLAPSHELFALVRQVPPTPQPGVHYLRQDLTQPLDRHQLPQQIDTIIHQAALVDTKTGDDALPFLVNVVATWRLLDYATAVGVKTFVHASTGGIYGCSHEVLRESDPPNPMDLYSLTKAQAELAVQAAPDDFHKIVLRYFFPYGVGTPNPIPSYVQRAVRGEPIEILDSGGPLFNPLYIADTVEATIQTLGLTHSAIINIAGQQVTSFAEIAQMAAHRVGRQPIFHYISDGAAIPYYRANLIADTTQMAHLLPLVSYTELSTGVAELVSHYAQAT